MMISDIVGLKIVRGGVKASDFFSYIQDLIESQK